MRLETCRPSFCYFSSRENGGQARLKCAFRKFLKYRSRDLVSRKQARCSFISNKDSTRVIHFVNSSSLSYAASHLRVVVFIKHATSGSRAFPGKFLKLRYGNNFEAFLRVERIIWAVCRFNIYRYFNTRTINGEHIPICITPHISSYLSSKLDKERVN